MALMTFMKGCGFIEHFYSTNLILTDFIGKFSEGKKKSLFCLRCSTDHRFFFCSLTSN